VFEGFDSLQVERTREPCHLFVKRMPVVATRERKKTALWLSFEFAVA